MFRRLCSFLLVVLLSLSWSPIPAAPDKATPDQIALLTLPFSPAHNDGLTFSVAGPYTPLNFSIAVSGGAPDYTWTASNGASSMNTTTFLPGSLPNPINAVRLSDLGSFLTSFSAYSNQLTGSIPSLSANTALATFNVSTNQITGYAGGGVSITLGEFYAANNLLTEAAVDAILADFVAANKITGTRILNIGGTGNATPSAAGLTDKATLVSRGWTVTTN